MRYVDSFQIINTKFECKNHSVHVYGICDSNLNVSIYFIGINNNYWHNMCNP